MSTYREYGFEWDTIKAHANRKKHGVSFDEAATVFGDDDGLIDRDLDHSIGEDRFIIVGSSELHRILKVVFTYRDDVVRIISARHSEPHEKRHYETKRRSR